MHIDYAVHALHDHHFIFFSTARCSEIHTAELVTQEVLRVPAHCEYQYLSEDQEIG